MKTKSTNFKTQQQLVIESLRKMGIGAEVGRKRPNEKSQYFSLVGSQNKELVIPKA
jgi:hypothetical protein